MPHSVSLRAGPLSLLLEQGEIRRVSLGDREVIRRIYLTLRGPDWSTIPAALSDLEIESGAETFHASWTLTHRQGAYDFTWRVTAVGRGDGTLEFAAKGRAASAFATNRVGLCVLHPLRECVGRSVRLTGPDVSVDSAFPETVSPRDPFTGFQSFAWDGFRLDYAGDVFETEDQRNWTDGSFKTYAPPQSQPMPRKIAAGHERDLSVTLRIPQDARAGAASPQVELEPDPAGPRPLPALGFGSPSHGLDAGPGDILRLKALAPSHLRVNLRLAGSDWENALGAAARLALALDAGLEAAVVAGEDPEAALEGLALAWRRCGARATRWLIFPESGDASDTLLASARRHLETLSPGAVFATGSKSDFVNLNRGYAGRDFPKDIGLAYAITPQVHLSDNRNLVESLEGQEWPAPTTLARWPGHEVAATPVTLKRSPFALALKRPAADAPPQADPSLWAGQADTRQLSLFGAGWTLGSFAALAGSGAGSATFFETTGSLGILAGETCGLRELGFAGSDLTAEPGWVYPMYHVFADLAEFRGGEFLPWRSSHPLRVRALGLRLGSRQALLAANLEGVAVRLRLRLPGIPHALRRLHAKNAMQAMVDPVKWRRECPEPVADGGLPLDLELQPYEIIRLDLH